MEPRFLAFFVSFNSRRGLTNTAHYTIFTFQYCYIHYIYSDNLQGNILQYTLRIYTLSYEYIQVKVDLINNRSHKTPFLLCTNNEIPKILSGIQNTRHKKS
jgi:hypothetical protein